MDITPPNRVFRLRRRKPEGRLLARFPGEGELPDAIQVDGTDDVRPTLLRGRTRIWISREKYTTPNQTLLLLKDGLVVGKACYDEGGFETPCVIDEPGRLAFFRAEAGPEDGQVTVSWKSRNEAGILNYILDRSINGVEFVPVDGPAPEGDGTEYQFIDTPGATGEIDYLLRALLDNFSEEDLGETSINI